MLQNNLEFGIDINLPPVMAAWLRTDFGVSAKSFNELNFDTEKDIAVFNSAVKRFNTIVITTKDVDFKNLSEEIIPGPRILYPNVGNVSNKTLKELIYKSLEKVIQIFSHTHESLIEITK
jgi:predicted nuclease of predicted toxin-antitoxin system